MQEHEDVATSLIPLDDDANALSVASNGDARPPSVSPPETLVGTSPSRSTLRTDSTGASDTDPDADVRALAVALSLTVGTLGAALPALVLLWLVLALLAMGVSAEALEQTGGLVPTTFGGGYWMAVAVNGLTVLVCFANYFRTGQRHPWRPLFWLIMFYAVLIWLLVPLDWKQSWNAPDIVTTFAILGADMLVRYLLPFALLSLLVSSLRSAWLASQLTVEAARRIIALGLTLGILGGTLSIALYLAGTEGYYDDFLPSDDEMESLDDFGLEEERLSYAKLAADIGPPAPDRYSAAYRSGRRGFHDCAEELATGDGDSESSPFHTAIDRLVVQGMSRADAEDTVMDTLLRVCLKDEEQGIDELQPYFHRAVCNNSKKHYRRSRRCTLDLDVDSCACDDDSPRVVATRLLDLRPLRKAFSRLRDDERQILELRFIREWTYTELAEYFDVSQAAARQRVKRARGRLASLFKKETK